MISARTAFQIFRSETNGTVSDFNSLPQEVSLPFKIRAAEEAMIGSLKYVEEHSEEVSVFAISTVHSVCQYLSTVASFLPLMARSNSAEKIAINYNALAQAVALFGGSNAALVKRVMELVSTQPDARQISFTEISDVEGAFASIEKDLKTKVKETGERTETLRKVAPEKPAVEASGDAVAGDAFTSSRKAQRRSSSKPVTVSSQDAGAHGDAPTNEAGDVTATTDTDAPPEKAAKHEGESSSSTTTATRRRPVAKRSQLVWGRLRALTNAEKKAVAHLNQMNQLLAHIYANKYNDLVPVFDYMLEEVKLIQTIVDAEHAAYQAKEDRKPPEPFHDVSLQELKEAITRSSQTFRNDEFCRLWLDEDLLYPIAHACLTVLNLIEGYETPAFVPPTEADLAKKHQTRVAFKEKREQAQRRVIERARAKEELANKKEEEKRQLRQQLGNTFEDDALTEDTELKDAPPLAYVAFPRQLPLGSVEAYEKALFIWCMMTSVPRALSLSQMPFSLFLKGLEEEDQEANGLMEEITRCLLDVSIEHVRVSSPSTPRITTRGKNWFDALVEFVGVASGNKKQRRQQRRAPTPSEEEDEDDDDEDDDDDDDDDDSSSSSSSTEEEEEEPQESSPVASPTSGNPDSAANEEAAAAASADAPAAEAQPEEEEATGFEKELKETMENVASLRSLATWGNVDLIDRLNLLQFCVQEAVASDDVRAAADAALKVAEENASAQEKRFKEIRDDAAKELKSLLKIINTSSGASAKKSDGAEDDGDEGNAAPATTGEAVTSDYEVKKNVLLRQVEQKREEVMKEVYAAQDGRDLDVLVTPLGMDRYKRLYWRFPFERVVHVQATTFSSTSDVPLPPKPAELRKLDMGYLFKRDAEAEAQEEEAVLELGRKRSRVAETTSGAHADDTTGEAEPTQSTWGVIAPEYIETFVAGLDPRGEREAHLRRALEGLAPYLLSLEEPQDTRVTRARAHTFGYLNRLKVLF